MPVRTPRKAEVSGHVLTVAPDALGWLYAVCSCDVWKDGPFQHSDEAARAHAAHVAFIVNAH